MGQSITSIKQQNSKIDQKVKQAFGLLVPISVFILFESFGKEILVFFDFKSKISTILFSSFTVWIILSATFCYSTFIENSKFILWKEEKKSLLFYVKSIISLILLFAVIAMAANFIVQNFGFSSKSNLPDMGVFYKKHPFLIFIVAITAGFSEEIIFRGYMLPRLQNIFKDKYIAIIISALLFGFAHFRYGTIIQILNPLLFGFLLALFYSKYRNLKVLIIAHFLWDFITLTFFS